jgi:hypothetical protein
MKPWINSEKPPGQQKQSSIRSLARRLRDWLNGYLEETADAAVDEAQPPAGVSQSTAVPPGPGAQDRLSGSSFDSQERVDPTPRSLFELAGPSEEWLRLVREGAPELLVPAEEGGTPWHGSPWAARGSQPRKQRESISSVPPLSLQPSPRKSEALVTVSTRTSLHAAASSESTWLNRLKRRLTPGVFNPRVESGCSGQGFVGSEQLFSASQPNPPREYTTGTSPKHTQVPRFGGADSLQVPPNERRSEDGLVERSGERSLPIAPVDFPAPEVQLARKKAEAAPQQGEKRTHPYSPAVSNEDSARQIGLEADRVSATTSVRSPQSKPASAMNHRPDLSISTRASETWTSGPSGSGYLETRTRNSIAGDRSTVSRYGLPATQRSADPWPRPLLSICEPEPERDDRWPALLESQPRATPGWELDLHRAEHLQALDIEQRGGS